MNSYNKPSDWKIIKWKNVEVVFIDCVHQYAEVKMDTINALKLPNLRYIIFDDYGDHKYEGVRRYVNEFIVERRNLGQIKDVVKFGIKNSDWVRFEKGNHGWFPFVDNEAILIELEEQ